MLLIKTKDLLFDATALPVNGIRTISWWLTRLLLMHQRILDERSSSLYDLLKVFMAETLQHFGTLENVTTYWGNQLHDIDPSEIVSTVHLEAGLLEHIYRRVDSCRKHFESAEVAGGLQLSVTGVLGFRTIHQVEPKAQMVLVANTSSSNTSDACPSISQVIHTHDSTIGDASDVFVTPKLLGNSHESETGVQCIHAGGSAAHLKAIQQAVILSKCLLIEKSSQLDEMQRWDMAPYIEAIDSQQSSCFILKFFCDLLRIRWESTRSRTKGRASEMMDKLVEGISNSSPGVTERIPFCYVIYVPTIPALRKEFAELLVSCGLIGEAIKIFEDLELWDNLIYCNCLLGKKAAAVELIKARLSEKPNDPRLWCSLGDVTNNDACYEKALEVSNDKSARAKRSLARSAYNRGGYETSKILWEAAMALSSLYPDGWFALGAAALKARDVEKALDGFTRAVQLDPDNGEAWNNIACLNSWQLWENYSHVALDVGNIGQALEAVQMVLNMTNNKRIDTELLERIVLDLEGRTSIIESESCRTTHNLNRTNNTCAKDLPVESVHVSSPEESIMGRSRENEHLMEFLGKILQQFAHVSMIIFFPSFNAELRDILSLSHISTTHVVRSESSADMWGLYARWLKSKGDLTMCSEALLKQVRSYQTCVQQKRIRDAGGFAGVNPPMPKLAQAALCPTFFVCPLSLPFRVVVAPHGTLTVRLWATWISRVLQPFWEKRNYRDFVRSCSRFPGDEYRLGVYFWSRPEYPFAGCFLCHGSAISISLFQFYLFSFGDSGMSNRKRKLIVDEGDEESGDSDLNVPIPTDYLGPSSSIGPSHGRDTLEYPRPLVISPSPKLELVGNRGGPASGSGENHGSGGVGVPERVSDGEGSSSGPSRPDQKRNLGHRVEADSYPIDFMACATTPTDLFKLRNLYNIPNEILLVVPGKDDVPSRPPRGYVTMHLESFKLGAQLPLQRYFAKILGGMHLAPGQLHPNGWRVLSAMFVLWERCGLEEPSLVEVKHLYQLRSSPREAGWYYFMSSFAKRKPITGFPSSCKNWKNKFFFAGGKWCSALRSLGGDLYLPTQFVTPESWGLVGGLEDRPLLQVKTALLNASTCQDLLSPTSLVGSGLVDIAAGMDNKILSAMSRKRGRGPSSSSNPPPPPKKPSVGPSKALVPALPPPPPRKSSGEKTSDKNSEKDYKKSVGPKMVKDIESMSLSELAASIQRVSFRLATMVSCYKIGSARHEKKLQADNQELKKKVESADRSKEKLAELNKQLSELEEKVAVAESTSSQLEGELGDLRSDLQATQIERDTLRAALEGEIKSLGEQLAEEKGKTADVDDRLDAEYDSGVAFSYKCIMSVLKEEYLELDMSKLEAGVERYMAGVGQGDEEQGEQNQVEAPLDEVQEGGAGGRAFEMGQGSMPPPPSIVDPPPPGTTDPSPAEAVDPPNP
ncbi:TPR REGION domain-containing protein [Citrus sinensis]|nr:TPR REGION domain-containing protein [Citrus sinensis]